MYIFQSSITDTVYFIPVVGETSYAKLLESADAACHRSQIEWENYVSVLTLDEGVLYREVM